MAVLGIAVHLFSFVLRHKILHYTLYQSSSSFHIVCTYLDQISKITCVFSLLFSSFLCKILSVKMQNVSRRSAAGRPIFLANVCMRCLAHYKKGEELQTCDVQVNRNNQMLVRCWRCKKQNKHCNPVNKALPIRQLR